jgi:hypothetical protein
LVLPTGVDNRAHCKWLRVLGSVSDPDPHGSAFNWSPGSGARRSKKR